MIRIFCDCFVIIWSHYLVSTINIYFMPATLPALLASVCSLPRCLYSEYQ